MFALIFVQILSLIPTLTGQSNNPLNDAQSILDSDCEERNTTAAIILSYNTFENCQKINTEYSKLNNGVPLVPDASQYQARNPQATLADFIFAQIYGQELTKIIYLKSALQGQFTKGSENILVQILIIEDSNRAALISSYNHYSQRPFLDSLKEYQNPAYRDFLVKLVTAAAIDKDEDTDPEAPEIENATKLLLEEMKKFPNSNENTQQLDQVLMSKTIEAAAAIIGKYTKSNNGVTLRDDVGKKFTSAELRFCYQSLIDFKTNQYSYMAVRIHESINDPNDAKATFILQIVGNSENGEIHNINNEFKNQYKKTITDFLMEQNKQQVVHQRLLNVLSRIPEPESEY